MENSAGGWENLPPEVQVLARYVINQPIVVLTHACVGNDIRSRWVLGQSIACELQSCLSCLVRVFLLLKRLTNHHT